MASKTEIQARSGEAALPGRGKGMTRLRLTSAFAGGFGGTSRRGKGMILLRRGYEGREPET